MGDVEPLPSAEANGLFAPGQNVASRVKHFLRDTFCGTTAGVLGIIVGYPLDTIKVTLQTSPHYKGSIDCFVGIFKSQGLVALFRGLASPISGYWFSSAVCFSSYGAALRWQKQGQEGQTSLKQAMLSGSFAGFTLSFVSNPIDRVKIIMQSQSSSANAEKYKNTLSCARHILKTQGMRSLYYGFSSNLVKETYGSSTWFGFYHGIKMMYGDKEEDITLGARVISGGMAGSLAWTFIYPFDVVRSRILKEQNILQPTYKGMIDCWKTSIAKEGYSWCFRGWRATIVRGFPVGAIILSMNDVLLGLTKDFVSE